MATFLQLTQEIAAEVNKGGLALIDTQIRQAINDAIAYYEVWPFRFNQGFDDSITTTSGTEIYDLPADLIVLRRAQILYSAGNIERLEILDWEKYQEDLREGSNSANGQSDFCSIYDDDIYLYPTPSGTFTLRLWYTKRIADTPLDDAGETSAWTTRARMLVKARAKYLLYLHRIGNAEWAEAMALDERAQLRSLQTEFSRQNTPRALVGDFC